MKSWLFRIIRFIRVVFINNSPNLSALPLLKTNVIFLTIGIFTCLTKLNNCGINLLAASKIVVFI